MAELQYLYDEIIKQVKAEGLKPFPGVLALSKESNVVVWDDESDDWKSFLDIAKEEGAKSVIVGREFGEEKHAEDVSSITVAWIKDGIVYLFTKRADWWVPEEEGGRGGAAAEITKKSEEELAAEAIDFIKKEFGDKERPLRGTDLFWKSKGLNRFVADPELQVKMEKVEFLVEEKLDEELLKREKEMLPSLVEECVKWAKENKLSKLTKSNVDYFLTDKSVRLSRTSKDVLYNQANFKLGRGK